MLQWRNETCVCVFIKLHITTQSGPVILVILCHSHWSSRGGINDTCYENLWSDATKGTRSLYLYNSYLSSEFLCVCVCVCVLIKLHITAQSGPVILVILCHSHWSSLGGINDTCYENLWSNARARVCVFISVCLCPCMSGLVRMCASIRLHIYVCMCTYVLYVYILYTLYYIPG